MFIYISACLNVIIDRNFRGQSEGLGGDDREAVALPRERGHD